MDVHFTNKTARMLGTCLGHKLKPGKNTVEMSKEDLATVLANDGFKSWQKLNWVTLRQPQADAPAATPGNEPEAPPPPAEDDPADLLEGVLTEDAKTLISSCSDLDLLRTWQRKEERKGVSAALEERLLALQADADPGPVVGEGDPEANDLPEGVDEVFDGSNTDEE